MISNTPNLRDAIAYSGRISKTRLIPVSIISLLMALAIAVVIVDLPNFEFTSIFFFILGATSFYQFFTTARYAFTEATKNGPIVELLTKNGTQIKEIKVQDQTYRVMRYVSRDVAQFDITPREGRALRLYAERPQRMALVKEIEGLTGVTFESLEDGQVLRFLRRH